MTPAAGQNANKLQVQTVGGQVFRALAIEGRAWFPVVDVAAWLAIPEDKVVSSHKAHRVEREVDADGAPVVLAFISELALYRLAFLAGSKGEKLAFLIFEQVAPWVVGPVRRAVAEAQRLGHKLSFTDTQWEWLSIHPGHLATLPFVLAGYTNPEIADELGALLVTVRQRVYKLESLGFTPKGVRGRKRRAIILEELIRHEQRQKDGSSAVDPG